MGFAVLIAALLTSAYSVEKPVPHTLWVRRTYALALLTSLLAHGSVVALGVYGFLVGSYLTGLLTLAPYFAPMTYLCSLALRRQIAG